MILRITVDGENVLTQAWGESVPGVPATTDNVSLPLFAELAEVMAPEHPAPMS